MAAYIIVDAYTGYVWGDTRDFNGKAYNAESIVDACRELDEAVTQDFGRAYEQVPRLPGDTGYIVYRVDVNGSEAVPVVHDGQDKETIDAVERDCALVGYVAYSNASDRDA
jgi:hypothetical protein